jgi:hypothetical protein
MLIEMKIEGTSPLLMNRFHEAAQAAVSSSTSTSLRGSKGTPREQCEPKLYLDANSKPVLPGPNLMAAITEAGKFVKAGKSKLTTQKSSLIPAGIAVVELELPITPCAWEPDSRAVVIPSTGGRVMAHRPRFDKWAVRCTLDVDAAMFDEKLVRELVDLAGGKVGVGDFRPQRKGPFGRFKVVSWKASK